MYNLRARTVYYTVRVQERERRTTTPDTRGSNQPSLMHLLYEYVTSGSSQQLHTRARLHDHFEWQFVIPSLLSHCSKWFWIRLQEAPPSCEDYLCPSSVL
jgi:hypothetical protein